MKNRNELGFKLPIGVAEKSVIRYDPVIQTKV